MSTSVVLDASTLDPFMLGQAPRRQPSEVAATAIRLPHPGRCPHQPAHAIFLFDNSGSVCGGNDPIGRRFEEVRIAVERVSKACRCRAELVSVLHFDAPTSRDVVAARLGRRGRAQLTYGMAVPTEAAGTSELGSSLARAYALQERYPKHHCVLVACTDFELLDDDAAEVLERFSNFPGIVHAVVLRAAPPRQLLDDQRVTVSQIGYDDPSGSVALAVFKALTATRHPTFLRAERP